jgi:hypothetical protein
LAASPILDHGNKKIIAELPGWHVLFAAIRRRWIFDVSGGCSVQMCATQGSNGTMQNGWIAERAHLTASPNPLAVLKEFGLIWMRAGLRGYMHRRRWNRGDLRWINHRPTNN